jgi:predicted negative regulator of RcsB-dependent stress response
MQKTRIRKIWLFFLFVISIILLFSWYLYRENQGEEVPKKAKIVCKQIHSCCVIKT